MRERTHEFDNIEHRGDFEPYAFEPLRNAGAKILDWNHDYDNETLLVRFELPNDSPEYVSKFYKDLDYELNKEE